MNTRSRHLISVMQVWRTKPLRAWPICSRLCSVDRPIPANTHRRIIHAIARTAAPLPSCRFACYTASPSEVEKTACCSVLMRATQPVAELTWYYCRCFDREGRRSPPFQTLPAHSDRACTISTSPLAATSTASTAPSFASLRRSGFPILPRCLKLSTEATADEIDAEVRL